MLHKVSSRASRRAFLVLAIAASAAFALSCGGPAQWMDGVFLGRANGAHGDIEVQVTVGKGKIAKVEVLSQKEEPGVSDLALQRIPAEIVKKQSLEVEAVSGASMTSKAIMAAAQDALQKAKK
jgi:urocanate reductase